MNENANDTNRDEKNENANETNRYEGNENANDTNRHEGTDTHIIGRTWNNRLAN